MAGDRWCGSTFNSNEAATTGGTMHGIFTFHDGYLIYFNLLLLLFCLLSSFLTFWLIIAVTSNPWEVTVSVDASTAATDTVAGAGYNLVSQQKACNSAFGGDTTQEN